MMRYLLLLLVLAAACAPRAEANVNNKPLIYEPPDTYKKFSRKNLGPYKVLPNGKIATYTNEFGIELPNFSEAGFNEKEILEYLYDSEGGFIQVYNSFFEGSPEFSDVSALYTTITMFIHKTPDEIESESSFSFLANYEFIYPGGSWIKLYSDYAPFPQQKGKYFPTLAHEILLSVFGTTLSQRAIAHKNKFISLTLFDSNQQFTPFPPLSPNLLIEEVSEERADHEVFWTNLYHMNILKSTNTNFR